MKLTRYQREHYPISRSEVLCASRKPLDRWGPGPEGTCPDCGRALKRGGRDHKPNANGAFGWIQRYGDGSFVVVPGKFPMPWCRLCEQSKVPAVHSTPLGETCCGPVFPEAPR